MASCFMKTAALVLFLAALGMAHAGDNPMKGPGTAKTASPAVEAGRMGEGYVIAAYQSILSPVGGRRCRMHPSCSRYAQECFKSQGLLRGYIMTCDRLMRCGRDECNLAPRVWVGGEKKYWDPVSENLPGKKPDPSGR